MASDGHEDIFGTGDIFADRKLVQVSHVPDLDRVVGRTDEINEVGYALGPATEGGPPETTIIYGKTGTGKSLVSRCVTREAARTADSNDATLEYAYIDCSDYQTDAQASMKTAKTLREHLAIAPESLNVPVTGLSPSAYRDKVWSMLDSHGVDSFVVILDEIDKLNEGDDNDILRSLSRAHESGKCNAHIGIICISNKIDYRDELEERVDSSLQDRELIFDPYDKDQIRRILESRRDAFHEGILTDDVLPLTASFAAREHGDARKAVDTLYEAGRIAEREQAGEVTERHVREAENKAEINRFQKLISGQTPHVKYLLRALAVLSDSNDRDFFRTAEVYDTYCSITDSQATDALSYDRVHALLKEQAFLNVTERELAGDGQGRYHKHRLLRDASVVTEALDNTK